MGAFASRRNAGVEEVDISTSNAYRYPPKSGCYFGSYFIMGGERFDTTQPEAYLFGENQDLNFLGNRPIPFPYPAPQANEPTKTLKSLVNIRKDSLRFIRVPDENQQKEDKPEAEAEAEEEEEEDEEEKEKEKVATRYNIEFTFDTDVRVAITIYYFVTEEINNGQAIYHPRDASMNSETYHYKRGANQTFSQSTHIIDPSKFPEEDWQYNPDKETIPIVIQCVVEDEGERRAVAEHTGHSHMMFALVDRWSDDGHVLKPLKQKQMVDGLCYLLQEIYGIENKNADRTKFQDDEIEDSGSECVICMSDVRDTLILPCRHLCLCNGCADNLRYQANNCPICRAPFRALLQIRAMRKKLPNAQPHLPHSETEDTGVSQEGVPPGYEAVSLIEALNGPNSLQAPTLQMPPDGIPPVRPTAPSLPTSPEESPILDRRKAKRHSSVRSNHSIREAPVVEEAEEAVEAGKGDAPARSRRGTPEIIMTGIADEPVKSPSGLKTPRGLADTRVPAGKVATTPESSPEGIDPAQKQSIEIINEVDREQEVEGATAAIPEVAILPADGAKHITPPPNYEQANDMPTVTLPSDVPFETAAHTMVLSDKAEDVEAAALLGQAAPTENMSLPGTPISTTDGSSYSSTSSTRVLLPSGVVPKAPDDKSTA